MLSCAFRISLSQWNCVGEDIIIKIVRMGVCSSTRLYQGELAFHLEIGDYTNGIFVGNATCNPMGNNQARYLIVNLIGKESVCKNHVDFQYEFMRQTLLARKLSNQREVVPFQKQFMTAQVQSNKAKLQGYSLTTTVYLECYLAKTQMLEPQSSDILPNSRRIVLLRAPPLPMVAQEISITYDPRNPQFSPCIKISICKNVFFLDQKITGKMEIDNRFSTQNIIKNQFSILQTLQYRDTNKKIEVKLPEVIMSQLLDCVHQEVKTIEFETTITQAFKDALSYQGQFYSVSYTLQFLVAWENYQEKFERPIYIVDYYKPPY